MSQNSISQRIYADNVIFDNDATVIGDLNVNTVSANIIETDIMEPKNNGNITIDGNVNVNGNLTTQHLITGNISGFSPIYVNDELKVIFPFEITNKFNAVGGIGGATALIPLPGSTGFINILGSQFSPWQSFTLLQDTLLTNIRPYSNRRNVSEVRIYEGIGTGGMLIDSKPTTSNTSVVRQNFTYPDLFLPMGNYTFQMVHGGGATGVAWYRQDGYAPGAQPQSSLGTTVAFELENYGRTTQIADPIPKKGFTIDSVYSDGGLFGYGNVNVTVEYDDGVTQYSNILSAPLVDPTSPALTFTKNIDMDEFDITNADTIQGNTMCGLTVQSDCIETKGSGGLQSTTDGGTPGSTSVSEEKFQTFEVTNTFKLTTIRYYYALATHSFPIRLQLWEGALTTGGPTPFPGSPINDMTFTGTGGSTTFQDVDYSAFDIILTPGFYTFGTPDTLGAEMLWQGRTPVFLPSSFIFTFPYTQQWRMSVFGEPQITIKNSLQLNCNNLGNVGVLQVGNIIPKDGSSITMDGDLCVNNILYTGNIGGKSPINVLDELNITSGASKITFEDGVEIGDQSTNTVDVYSIAIGNASEAGSLGAPIANQVDTTGFGGGLVGANNHALNHGQVFPVASTFTLGTIDLFAAVSSGTRTFNLYSGALTTGGTNLLTLIGTVMGTITSPSYSIDFTSQNIVLTPGDYTLEIVSGGMNTNWRVSISSPPAYPSYIAVTPTSASLTAAQTYGLIVYSAPGALGTSSIAIGNVAASTGLQSIAMGASANASDPFSIALGSGAVTGGNTRSFALTVNDDSINTSGAVPYLQCVVNGDDREIPLSVVTGLDPDINVNSICANTVQTDAIEFKNGGNITFDGDLIVGNILYTGNIAGASPINVLDELNITSAASKITFEDGIEIGTGAIASDSMSIVIGEGAQAVNGGLNNIAIGVGALARGGQNNQICIGNNARTRTGASWGSNAVAIGNGAYVGHNAGGIAIGPATAGGDGAISIGNGSNTGNSSRSIAFGYFAACSGSGYQYEQISIGNGSDTTNVGGIAIGRLAASYAAHGIAIGSGALVTNATADAINAYGTGSVCIGENAETSLPNSVIIGKNCGGTGSPGYNMTAGSGQNVVIGYNSGAAMRCRFGNIVIGSNTGNGVGGTGEFPGYGGNPLGCNNVVIGPSINAGGGWDRGHVAIGHVITMGGSGGRSYSVAIGRNVTNTRNTGVAIGVNSVCSADNHFVLGGTNITSLRCNVTGITAISDERDKCNVEPFFEGIDFIKQLNPVKFNLDPRGNYPDNNFVSDGSKCDNTPRVGFLAQEVKQVQVDGNCDFLNIVIDETAEQVNGILEDGNVISGNIDTYRINLDHLHPVYINAFKNLIQVNSDQGNIIANLEARITALESV